MLFFDEVTICLGKAITKYDHVILAGDLNVDMDIPKTDTKGFLQDLCDTFDLTNLINTKMNLFVYPITNILTPFCICIIYSNHNSAICLFVMFNK